MAQKDLAGIVTVMQAPKWPISFFSATNGPFRDFGVRITPAFLGHFGSPSLQDFIN